MSEFITLLRQRYQTVLKAHSQLSNHYQQIIEQLTLAEAFFQKGVLRKNLPLQIAIIGPTQAGKSSLTNVFLQSTIAGVSPLAGYTVHPQGFIHNISFAECNETIADYFKPFQWVDNQKLNKQKLACYTLSQSPINSHFLPACVFWDTPDFDSIDSVEYRTGVLKTIALSDIIILAVSKEKYADQTVWDTLKLIEPLRQPTLICVNKLSEDSESIILESLKQKWRDYRQDALPSIIPILYQKTHSPEIADSQQQVLFELAQKVQREKQTRREQKLLQLHWQTWTEPLRKEHEIYQDWQTVVDTVIQNALNDYERDYLNHPRHYETFKQAIAELLLLLEIPSVAKVMFYIHNPFKRLKSLFGSFSSAQTSNEQQILIQLINHILIDLQHQLLDKNAHSLWHDIAKQLRHNQQALHQTVLELAENYHANFQQDIENAAKSIYSKLEEQPLVLNTLRATRISADAAVITLALYTGGIGLHDLAIAPAMLMFVNFLTESAIGLHMKKIETDLKFKQRNAVKAQIFDLLAQQLHDLPKQLQSNSHFAISPEQLFAVESTFNEKPHGLRLL